MHKLMWAVLLAAGLSACATTATRSVVAPAPAAAAPNSQPARSEIPPDGITDWKEAAALIARLDPATTLVVIDIDDTLLTSPTVQVGDKKARRFFGSDHWYEWQSKMLKPGDSDKVPCLFDVIPMNYETGTQEPTQADAPGIVDGIKLDKLMLTSRAPASRSATERTLVQAKYKLFPTLGRPRQNLDQAEQGLLFRINGTHMSYANGIFMTAGGDKGELLFDLLKRLGRSNRYSSVVLIDDGARNIESVRAATARRHVDYYGLRYTRIKGSPPEAPSEEQIIDARAGWKAWLGLLEVVYPERKRQLESGICGS